MSKLAEQLISDIAFEIGKGTSIPKMSKMYDLGKGTIYYYYKKLKGKKFVPPNTTPGFSEKEGEITGIFAGDGSQYFEPKKYHYTNNIHFGIKNLGYALYVKSLFEAFFKKNFRLKKEGDCLLRLQTYSKDIFYFFKNYLEYDSHIKHCTVRLKSGEFPLAFKIGFLRGMIDTDGYIKYVAEEKRYKIVFCTTSEKLAEQISAILTEFEFKNSLRKQVREFRLNEKPVYYITVFNESADKFINVVHPLKARTGNGLVVKPGITSPWLNPVGYKEGKASGP